MYLKDYLTIKTTDIDLLGKNTITDVYHYLHDKYLLTFDEVKSERNFFDKEIVKSFLNFNKEIKKNEISDIDLLKKISDKIKNKTLDMNTIFNFLEKLKINSEINEDLYYKIKGFVNLYESFYFNYFYIQD